MRENYTSAMLSSAGLQQFTYGKFAAKIKLPYGQGMWPA
jgi:beta-glucanase (GH16 family)